MRKHLDTPWQVGRLVRDSFRSVYKGFGIRESLVQDTRQRVDDRHLSAEMREAQVLARAVLNARADAGFKSDDDVCRWALWVVDNALNLACGATPRGSFRDHLISFVGHVSAFERWFVVPDPPTGGQRSDLWAWEDNIKRTRLFFDKNDDATALIVRYLATIVHDLATHHPPLLNTDNNPADFVFETRLEDVMADLPKCVEQIQRFTFADDLEPLALFQHTRARLNQNLIMASGYAPTKAPPSHALKLPTKNKAVLTHEAVATYLGNTPLEELMDFPVPIQVPMATRFEHMHIVAGSGHGKTQTLQALILRDLERVAAGEASIIVMDSQSDLINTIAGLGVFAPGGALSDRLVHIDPTDIEWPVALNLFDGGLERLDHYEPLDRERLTNSILELYDFVLGSLLDAGMTQKQSVIFRYITRLLLHIPGATIHTLRELLEDGGSTTYQAYIAKLTGSARAFFESEFDGKEFAATKRQVVRRLYGILENQTFERMFTHPKSKLDLFSEMNAGKVILINTAKDLLKEQGTEIFGRFFIALITQAAQERAVLPKSQRLPTFVYVDEASDYFDRNISTILSQARKYNVGMVLAHQFLGQLEPRLHDAIAANTAIKFAGGVSAKDARALASDLRTDAAFIEKQAKFQFAAYIKGQTKRAVSICIEPGQMEALPRLSYEDRQAVRDAMRRRYAVHHSALSDETKTTEMPDAPPEDDGAPMPW